MNMFSHSPVLFSVFVYFKGYMQHLKNYRIEQIYSGIPYANATSALPSSAVLNRHTRVFIHPMGRHVVQSAECSLRYVSSNKQQQENIFGTMGQLV